MAKIKTYFRETYDELVNKVSWPSRQDVQNSAIIVMIAALIIAVVVAVMDFSLKEIMDFIYSIGSNN